MQAKAISVAAALGLAAGGWSSPSADAATCYRNAVYNDVAGHRTLIREETRCVAGRRYAYRPPVVRSTTRTVVRDEYVTTSRPYTTNVIRDEYYAVPVTRDWDQEIGYGSSYPEPMPNALLAAAPSGQVLRAATSAAPRLGSRR
jgi:hypothetical protein